MMQKNIDLNDPYFHEYLDRGIQKWQGMYLSEHTAELEKEKQREQHRVEPKEKLSELVIQHLLKTAYESNQMIAVQLEIKDLENNYCEDIIGTISGFDTLGIWLDTTLILYDEIRHVEIKAFHKWSEV